MLALPLIAAGAVYYDASAASAADCQGPPRKINVGVSVSPPNVVHTTPYIAKELGLFAKHCVDANIIQFDGGESPAATAAVSQGTAISNVNDVAIGRGMRARQFWGLAPRPPQVYAVGENIKTAADLKGKRLSAAGGGVGSFNWRMGREVLRSAARRGRICLGQPDQELHLGRQRGLRSQADGIHRQHGCGGRRYRSGQEAELRSGGRHGARQGGGRSGRRPGHDRQLQGLRSD